MSYIRLATDEDKEAILGLYRSLIGTPGCPWSMQYPTMPIVESDIGNQALYCLCDEQEGIVAVASADLENDLDQLVWNDKVKTPCNLARVGVKQSMQNRGYGHRIVVHVINEMKKRGYDGVRMLVCRKSSSAITLYEKIGFYRCGEVRMYEHDWYYYEMVLD